MTLEALVYEHRMLNTYAGYDWGDPIQLWTIDLSEVPALHRIKRLSWPELEAELDWLRDGGVSAALALTQLGLSTHNAYRRCSRHGRHDLAAWIDATTDRFQRKEVA